MPLPVGEWLIVKKYHNLAIFFIIIQPELALKFHSVAACNSSELRNWIFPVAACNWNVFFNIPGYRLSGDGSRL
jgi:hypothetical protein